MASKPTRRKVRLTDHDFRRCESQKVGYRTRDEALTAVDRMMHNDRVRPGCHLTPYQCEICGEWHVANRRIIFPPLEPLARPR